MADDDDQPQLSPGARVVIVRGPLSGIEATVLRPARLGFHLIQLDADAPWWAAIRRTRAAGWALAPIDGAAPAAPAAPVLERRRRIGFLDVATATVLLPFLFRVWNVLPALAVVIAVGTVVGLAALHSTDRVDRRRPSPSS